MAARHRNVEKLVARLVVPPSRKGALKKCLKPGWTPGNMDKKDAAAQLQESVELLAEYQDKLYAQNKWAVLVIFQAMDAAGKDGAIKHVMSGINPQGCQVFSFKAPSAEELDHSYLWRCFKALPERGRIGIFNRSYYEEVLVAKVHPEILARQQMPDQFKDKRIYQRRYEEINNFEKYLYYNGVLTLKFFLNVSKEEQKKRFLERIERPEKNWKFSATDVSARGHWDAYMKAYEDCFQATSTSYAPWHVIPADNKWFSRVAISAVIYNALKRLNLAYPEVPQEQKAALLEAKKLLNSEK